MEGNSAGSGVRNASDPMTQAIFTLRGVPANAFKHNLSTIMENREWRDLVTVLRCGIGKDFDIDKLYFDRINIFTDEDVDGYYISASILAFFYKHLRPIIEAGKLYKVFSPLYQLKGEKKDESIFVANKSEMIYLYHKKITKAYSIRLESEKSKMSKDDFMVFLYDTYEYTTRLAILSEDSGRVDKVFIETVISFLVIIGKIDDDVDVFNDIYSINPVIEKVDKLLEDQKFITKYMSALQKLYPEIHLKDNTLSGIVNERFVSLKLSHRFIKKAAFSIKIYQKYGYWLRVTNKKNDVEKKMSIIQFLDECTKITPKILHRFKGLSEIDHKDLASTTMDINHRISVQYTIEDVEDTLARFNITHGTSSEDVENRKKMMKLYKIKREDLDN